MSRKLRSLLGLAASSMLLAACQGQDAGENPDQEQAQNQEQDQGQEGGGDQASGDFSIAMVTDEGGVDDRSFNQSAWEGMQEWSDETGNESTYFQSDDTSDFVPNLNQAIQGGYDIVYGIGFMLRDSIEEIAQQNEDQYFGIVDDEVDLDNVVSLNFGDHEASFLAGVAAALTTETGQVGFIGGIESPIIDRFETGFLAGVEHVDDTIEVDVQYAESFGDAAQAQQIANGMYSSGADIIFHAAGAAGNGLFTEARNRMEDGSDTQLWVIGVDRDQEAEGEWSGGNLTLTSTIKEVGNAIVSSVEQTQSEGFPGGENIQYGLANDGVDIVEGNMEADVWEEVQNVRQQILDGEIEVPEFSQEWDSEE